jgi:hypothetical protein
MAMAVSLCAMCKHRRDERTCDAFPDGIPTEVYFEYDHRLPYPGDHGIRFEMKDELKGGFFDDLAEPDPTAATKKPLIVLE